MEYPGFPKFNYLDTLPLLAEPYINAAIQYFPFTIRHTFKSGIQWRFGMELEDQGMVVTNTFFGNNSDNYLMYGSPKELLEQLKIFVDFSGNNTYFGNDLSNHYFNSLKFYNAYSNPGKQYICKNDFFLYLQNKLVSKEEFLVCRLPLAVLSIFLKTRENLLEGTCEFVLLDKSSIDSLERELIQLAIEMRRSAMSLPEFGHNLKKYSARFQKLLPEELTEKDLFMVHGILKELLTLNRHISVREAEQTAAQYYNFCAIAIPGFQKIMDSRPQWFLPDCKVNPKLLPSKPIIRLFIDGKSKFIFTRDLAHALKFLSVLTQNWNDETDIVDTVDLETAKKICESYGVGIEKIELIETPIKRAKHSAVPIPSGTPEYCKPAADVLLELINELLFGSHIFEGMTSDRAGKLRKVLEDLCYVFNSDVNSLYLINDTMSNDITLMVLYHVGLPTSSKHIRKVSSDGFYSDDIKKELQYLSLNSFFKDVYDHVSEAYLNVIRNKKERVLRTCDMYDAVENCVLLSLMKMFPKLAHFLHTQNACHRIPGLQCKYCESPDSEQLIPSFFSQKSTVTHSTVPSTKFQFNKSKLNRILKGYYPGAVEEKEPETPKIPKNSENSAPKTVPKSCENCLKSSEKCQKTQEKLKNSEKMKTSLETKLVGMKANLAENQENAPKIPEFLEQKYMESMANVKKEVKEKREKKKEDLGKIGDLERKLSAQQKEIKEALRAKLEELEKSESDAKDSLEPLETENFRLGVQQEDKDATIKKLTDKLKALGVRK